MTPETTPITIPHSAETREDKLAAALIAPHTCPPGLRRYSAASMIVLQLLRNPLADFTAAAVRNVVDDLYSLAEFVWVHIADPAKVRQLAYNALVDHDSIRDAVLEFAERYTPAALLTMIPDILRDAEQVEAAMATTIPEGTPSKNIAGHSSQQ